MNKAQLVETLLKGKENGIDTKAAAERAIDAVLGGIKTGLKKDKSVQLIGFGTFEVKARKARKGHNPATGQPITIKASKTVRFKVGKGLKDAIKR